VTNPKLPAFGGLGGWFDPKPEDWARVEITYGQPIPESLRRDICTVVARYTEEHDLELKAEAIDDAQKHLRQIRDRATQLFEDLQLFEPLKEGESQEGPP
jgi:hypothetical protein